LLDILRDYVELPADEEIDTSAAFRAAVGADSFIFLSMIGAIEDRFGVKIPNADLLQFKTLDDIILYLEKRVEK